MNWIETADKLENEFLKRYQENEEKKQRIQKILEENDEIRRIKQKISESYLRKNHTAQIFEKEIRKTEEMKKEIQMLREFQKMRNEEGKQIEIKKMKENIKIKEYKMHLMDQIEEKKNKVYESREEYMKDRQLVEEVIQKIIREEQE